MSSPSAPHITDPLEVPPLSAQPPIASKVILLPAHGGSSSHAPELEGSNVAENPKEGEESQKMQEKVTEVEDKAKAKSKAKSRAGGVRGQWWPCELKDKDLLDLQSEGFLKADTWRFVPKEPVPAPKEDEHVITKALVERGFSFPPSDFL